MSYWRIMSNIIRVQTNNVPERSKTDKANFCPRHVDPPSPSLMPSPKRSSDFLNGCRSNEIIVSYWLQRMQLSSIGWRRQWSQHRQYSRGLQKEKTQRLISQRQLNMSRYWVRGSTWNPRPTVETRGSHEARVWTPDLESFLIIETQTWILWMRPMFKISKREVRYARV